MEIDWAYLRKGWTSCKNAQEFLETKQLCAKDVVDARKTRIDEDEAWTMLKTASSVTVTKGKKVQTFISVADEKEALLQQVMGPSGNLRAPTYRVKDQFVIGFNEDFYEEWVNWERGEKSLSHVFETCWGGCYPFVFNDFLLKFARQKSVCY